jgi:hypothetical protein
MQSSNCSKDTTSASWQDSVQGLNYVSSSKGDENMNTGDQKVEISLGSSTNKPMKKPYVRGVQSLSVKVSSFFLLSF